MALDDKVQESTKFDFYGLGTWKKDCGLAKFQENVFDGLFLSDRVLNRYISVIDGDPLITYHAPVVPGFVINQPNPQSWKDVGCRMAEQIADNGRPVAIVIQHDFGLDSDWTKGSCSFYDFIISLKRRAKELEVKDEDIIIMPYFHTYKEKIKLTDYPELQREGLRKIASVSDTSIVMIPQGTKILKNDYVINSRVDVIEHGVRAIGKIENDREQVKTEMGLEDTVLFLSMGYQGPNKGLEYGLEAYSRFLHESVKDEDREKIVYLVTGDCHPNALKADADAYQVGIRKKVEKLGLTWGNAHYTDGSKKRLVIRKSNDENKIGKGPKSCDVVFVQERVSESNYKRYLAAANVVVQAYPDEGQPSSGILTDAVGAGRCVLSTSFEHALYLLSDRNKTRAEVLDELQRTNTYGLHDPNSPGVMANIRDKDYMDIMAGLMHRLTEDKQLRLAKEIVGRRLRTDVYWPRIADRLVGLADFLRREKMTPTGRGPDIELKPGSRYAV